MLCPHFCDSKLLQLSNCVKFLWFWCNLQNHETQKFGAMYMAWGPFTCSNYWFRLLVLGVMRVCVYVCPCVVAFDNSVAYNLRDQLINLYVYI